MNSGLYKTVHRLFFSGAICVSIVSFLAACQSGYAPNFQFEREISIPSDIRSDDLIASMFIDSIEYVFLSTDENSIIAEVTNLQIINDTIVVFDRKLNRILTFSISGSFINDISSEFRLNNLKIINVNWYDRFTAVNISNMSKVFIIDNKGKSIYDIPSSPYKLLFGFIDNTTVWSFFPSLNGKFNKGKYFLQSDLTGNVLNRDVKIEQHSYTINHIPRLIFYSVDS